MKKIILILIFILTPFLLFLFFSLSVDAGSPTKIRLRYLTIYEIGSSHTPGSDKTGGVQKCQVGAADLEANCPVGTPCTCDAQVQENYYYRIEFELENTGATADGIWGYFDNIEELNGTVSSSSDIWVVDNSSQETCSSSDWSSGRLTWVETDAGCDLNLGDAEIGQMMFIIKIGSGATDTSGGNLLSKEDTSGDQDVGGVNITVASALTCNFSTTTASFGTITTSAVSTAYGSTTVDITSGGAVYLKVQDDGDTSNPGLYKSTATTDLIGSATAAYADTAALVAGTEGYGLQATSTNEGSGSAMTISYRYDNASTTNDVGGLELTDVTMASSTAAVTNRRVIAYYKAAVDATNIAGSYTDILTYTCSATP